jgi:hypothetical protein
MVGLFLVIRRRILLALLPFLLVGCGCLFIGRRVLLYFARVLGFRERLYRRGM